MSKDTAILIRTSPQEKEDFERSADIAGLSLSGWIRQKLRTAAIAELKTVDEKPKFLDSKE